jgi:hypothetical protein
MPRRARARRSRRLPASAAPLPHILAAALVVLASAPGPAPAESATAPSATRVEIAYKEYRVRYEAGELAEALGPAKRAYDYAQQDLGIDDEQLARSAAALGALLLDLDRPLDALRPLTHARELFDHQRGRASSVSRRMQLQVADANERLGRTETAERAFLDVIARAEDAEGDHRAEMAGVYARLQTLTLDAKAYPRARRYGLRSMRLYEQARGKESLPVGLVAVKLARGSLEGGEWAEGLDFLEYGVPILEKRLERGDPQLTTLYEFLVEVYEQVGDVPRARRYRVRLKKNRAAEPVPSSPSE